MKKKDLLKLIKGIISESDTAFVNKLSREDIDDISEDVCDAVIDYLVEQSQDTEYLFNSEDSSQVRWAVEVTHFINEE